MRILTRVASFLTQRSFYKTAQTFSFAERVRVIFFALLAVGALVFWLYTGFIAMTVEGPKRGGVYTEAVFGQPTYYNPLLLRMGAEGEAEANVTMLVYSSLFRPDGHGGIVPDLAERYERSSDGKQYTVFLKKNALWHDGERVTANDVVYTIHTIQDKRFTISPALVRAWADIDVQKVDDFTVRFVLKKPFVSFVAAQLRVGILPAHIWQNVEPDAFALAKSNVQPVGSGPYKLQENATNADGALTSTTLSRFRDYYGDAPYIDRIKFSYFSTEDAVVEAYTSRQVMGAGISAQDVARVKDSDGAAQIHRMMIPSVYGVFFNPLKSAALAYTDVRRALTMATDRTAIIGAALGGEGVATPTPFVPGMTWYSAPDAWGHYDVDAANALLEKNGWKKGDDGIRAREGTVLRFSLVVPDWDSIVATADSIKEQWRRVGADVQVKVLASDAFRTTLAERSYGALLFGQTYFSFDADPFAFWHSSQKNAPGLNFSQLSNKDIDKILTQAQSELDDQKRSALYRSFNEKLAKNAPATFLYTPYYILAQSHKVHGVTVDKVSRPADRFATIGTWYVATKRVFTEKEKVK